MADKSGTEPKGGWIRGAPESDEFYTALGKFIHKFSAVEHITVSTAITMSGLQIGAGHALLGGYRIDQAKDAIKRLIDVRSLKAHPRLNEAFEQLGHISDARNLMVHFPVQFRETGPTAMTNFAAKIRREIAVDVDNLDNMTADLETISFVLTKSMLMAVGYPDFGTPESIADFDRKLRAPWRYKPPSQSHRKSKPQHSASRQSERRQQQPSRK